MRNDIISSVGSMRVFAKHEAGCEAAIHAMHTIFENIEDKKWKYRSSSIEAWLFYIQQSISFCQNLGVTL